MDIAAVLGALGAGTLLGALLQHHLNQKSERRQRRIDVDRASYQDRLTRLITGSVYALIHSDRCRDGEREELAELIQTISDGAYRDRFLDPKVHAAWVRLLDQTAECGWRRLTNAVTEQDTAKYGEAWEAWMKASRDAFGPLPEGDPPRVRRSGAERSADAA